MSRPIVLISQVNINEGKFKRLKQFKLNQRPSKGLEKGLQYTREAGQLTK